jgi:hypothetical protein
MPPVTGLASMPSTSYTAPPTPVPMYSSDASAMPQRVQPAPAWMGYNAGGVGQQPRAGVGAFGDTGSIESSGSFTTDATPVLEAAREGMSARPTSAGADTRKNAFRLFPTSAYTAVHNPWEV